MDILRIGEFSLTWGESLVWDDLKNRLYFVDCSTSILYWLNGGELPLHSMLLPSMPTGIGMADDPRLVIALDDGLFLVDPDSKSVDLMCAYPQKLGRRANDVTVDSSGNLVTGSLKESGNGSYWWYSNLLGWKELDSGISNANGPVTSSHQYGNRLVFADTPERKLYAYDYSPEEGTVSGRRIFAETSEVGGSPDGACLTSDNEILSCILGAGIIAHYTDEGLQSTFIAGSEQPSDIAFGGANLDRLFVTSIQAEFGHGVPKSKLAGSLVEIRGSGLTGVKENRFRLVT